MSRRPEPCPSCGSAGVPIAYGYPGDDMMTAAERGEIALGGCVVSANDPRLGCNDCGRTWGHPRVELTEQFERALAFATTMHNGQVRKETQIPYVSHLLGASSLVLENGGDETEAIAALLHDVIEDCGGLGAEEQIVEAFGQSVARIVRACSDTDVLPKPPWRERKEHHLATLRHAPKSVLLVTAGDKLHNLRSILADARLIGPSVFERFNAGRDGTLWYYGEIVALLVAGPLNGMSIVVELRAALDELLRLVDEPAEGIQV